MDFLVCGLEEAALRRRAGEAMWAEWERRLGDGVPPEGCRRALEQLEVGLYGAPVEPEAFGLSQGEAWARGGGVRGVLDRVARDPLGVWNRGALGSVWFDAEVSGDNVTRQTRVALSVSPAGPPAGDSAIFRLTLMPWHFD